MYIGLQLPWDLSRFHLKPDGEADLPGCKLAGLIPKELTQDVCLGQPQEKQFFTPVCQNLKRL